MCSFMCGKRITMKCGYQRRFPNRPLAYQNNLRLWYAAELLSQGAARLIIFQPIVHRQISKQVMTDHLGGAADAQNTPNSFDEPFSSRLPILIGQIDELQGSEGPASANIQIWDRAIIKTNGQEGMLIGAPEAKLFNSEEKLLSLIGSLLHLTIFGETGNECQAVSSDSLPDFIPPVLIRPQAAYVTPDWNTVCLEECLQAISARPILPDI